MEFILILNREQQETVNGLFALTYTHYWPFHPLTMENTSLLLVQLNAKLYALLALLGVLLLLTGSIAYWQIETKLQELEPVAICGTPNGSVSLSPLAAAGKELFTANCASCHHKNMRDNLTGPALHGVEERWGAYPRQDLYNWIRHSQKMIRDKHPRAQELWQKYGKTIMTDFPSLTDMQIEQLLAYIASR